MIYVLLIEYYTTPSSPVQMLLHRIFYEQLWELECWGVGGVGALVDNASSQRQDNTYH